MTRARRALGSGWWPTDALRRGLVVGLALVTLGVLLHRAEAVLIGAPLLLGAVLGLSRTPAGAPAVRVRPGRRDAADGAAPVVVEIDVPPGADLVAVRLPAADRPGPGPVHVLAPGTRELSCPTRPAGAGGYTAARPDHLVAGADALFVFGPVLAAETRRVVLPDVRPIPAGPLPPRPAGLVGGHRTRRAGDGTDLRDIRPFAPGDRVRRIDWRVSLRTDRLHVRETAAEADADVLLALDTRVDVGRDVAAWAGARPQRGTETSLDTAAVAATALAAAHLRLGDRVGLADLGRPQLSLPPRAGRRQLLALRSGLVRCVRSGGWAPRPALPPHRVPSGALVVVLSPFLDDAVAGLTATLARRGATVLAVDVLPGDPLPDHGEKWGAVALALLMAERRARLDALAHHGVPVIAWGDGAAVAATLRRLSHRRPAGARR